MKKIELYLISDSTGETVCSVARAVIAQFSNVEANEHVWSLVRTKKQLAKITKIIDKNPGPVMYTIVDKELRDELKACCRILSLPCIPVLSRAIADLSTFLNMQTDPLPGKQHEMDSHYFSRVEAVNYAISHDDGQSSWDLDEADIILVGVSRTSKSPTCMYLAHRGYRTANIPFVLNCPLPTILSKNEIGPLIVGLTIGPERLMQIRKSRLLSLNEQTDINYADIEVINDELVEARKLFSKNNWPVIDVTRKSVEEVAAVIIQHYQIRKSKLRPSS